VADDTRSGGAGPDSLDGGAGNDTASYVTAAAGLVANLLTPASNTGEAAGDSYTSIANLAGSNSSDTLTGDGNANTLSGLLGNDILIGGAGADSPDGGTSTEHASY